MSGRADRGSRRIRTPSEGSDRRFLLAMVLGFCALTALPTIVAASSTPPAHRFTGFVTHPYDLTYYAASQRGAAIGSTRANRFTSEVAAPGPIAPLYPGLGRIERALGLSPTSLFHLPQVVGAPILVLLVWWLAGLLHRERSARRWATALALFGAGAAAVLSGEVGQRSADAALFELTPVLSVATMPHFTVAYIGMVLVWGAIASGAAGRGIVRAAGVGAGGGLLLGLSHGFLLVPALAGGAAVALYLLATGRRREGVAVGASGAAALLTAGPFLLALSREQTRFERLQGETFPSRPADAWWTWATAEPVLWALLAVAVVVLIRRKAAVPPLVGIPAVWLLAQGALIFLPVTVFQRRFAEGIVIPAALVAGAGAAWMLRQHQPRMRLALCLLLALPSLSLAWQAGSRSLSVDRATDQLASALDPDDVVLAGHALSWQLPAISPATTYLGRDVETLNYPKKRADVMRFVLDPSSPVSQAWLVGAGITVIALDDRDPTLTLANRVCFTDLAFGPHLRLVRPTAGCGRSPALDPVIERP